MTREQVIVRHIKKTGDTMQDDPIFQCIQLKSVEQRSSYSLSLSHHLQKEGNILLGQSGFYYALSITDKVLLIRKLPLLTDSEVRTPFDKKV